MEQFKFTIKKEAEHVRLSPKEKYLVRKNLMILVNQEPVRTSSILRYNNHRPLWSVFTGNLILKPMIIILALAILVSGGISYAAEESLPGDILYSVKIEVNEKVRSFITVSEEANASWQVRIVERRLEETEELDIENRIDEKMLANIKTRFEEHAERVKTHIATLEEKEHFDAAADISSHFETSLHAHAEILNRMSEDRGKREERDIRPLVLRIRSLADDAATSRIRAETNLFASSSIAVKNVVEKKQATVQQNIADARIFIQRDIQGRITEKEDAEAGLMLAINIFEDGEKKMQDQEYGEAFALFQKAQQMLSQTKLLIATGKNLHLNIRLDIPSYEIIPSVTTMGMTAIVTTEETENSQHTENNALSNTQNKYTEEPLNVRQERRSIDISNRIRIRTNSSADQEDNTNPTTNTATSSIESNTLIEIRL